MKTTPMKTNEPNSSREESTYALLVRSEDKNRARMEMVVYGLAAISALAMILAFANEFFWFPA
jgi:hypothetical protein